MARVHDILTRAQRKLSVIPGVTVQQYMQDRLIDAINEKFRDVARRDWFPEHMQWFERQFDGTDGYPTQVLSDILSYRDIRAVYSDRLPNTPLPHFNKRSNPYQTVDGTQALSLEYIGPPEHIRAWPRTADDSIRVHARVIKESYGLNDEVPADDHMLAAGAAYVIAEADGTNPADVAKLQQEFEDRFRQWSADKDGDITLNPYTGAYPHTWWVG